MRKITYLIAISLLICSAALFMYANHFFELSLRYENANIIQRLVNNDPGCKAANYGLGAEACDQSFNDTVDILTFAAIACLTIALVLAAYLYRSRIKERRSQEDR